MREIIIFYSTGIILKENIAQTRYSIAIVANLKKKNGDGEAVGGFFFFFCVCSPMFGFREFSCYKAGWFEILGNKFQFFNNIVRIFI